MSECETLQVLTIHKQRMTVRSDREGVPLEPLDCKVKQHTGDYESIKDQIVGTN